MNDRTTLTLNVHVFSISLEAAIIMFTIIVGNIYPLWVAILVGVNLYSKGFNSPQEWIKKGTIYSCMLVLHLCFVILASQHVVD